MSSCSFRLVSLILLIAFAFADDRPNILVVIADDWGWNDVGYHLNTDTETPFIDELAKDGLRLEHFYTFLVCSPSRTSFFTGRYAFRFGMQGALMPPNPFGLTRQETILSEEFKKNGYRTHLIGKWHLGFVADEYTPIRRGFDSFYGFYNGEEDYFGHNYTYNGVAGKDFRDFGNIVNDTSSSYGPDLHFNRMQQIIGNWSRMTQPFFTVLSMQSSHEPSQAPESYLELYSSQPVDTRKNFQAQTTHADDKLKEMVQSLKAYDLWDNTLLIFISDNGATSYLGDNSPLRGEKGTHWEGGVRTPAFVSGGYLSSDRRGQSYPFPAHITDWYQTLLNAADIQGSINQNKKYDGVNLWPAIQYGEISDELENRELALFINNNDCSTTLGVCGALRHGKWKLIYGNSDITECSWVRYESFENDTLGCGDVPSELDSSDCPDCSSGCLYDIVSDPCEYYEVSSDYPEVLEMLLARMVVWNSSAITSLGQVFEDDSTGSDPSNFNGYWSPWKTADELEFESWLSEQWKEKSSSEKVETISIEKEVKKGTSMIPVILVIVILSIFYIGICAYQCVWRLRWEEKK